MNDRILARVTSGWAFTLRPHNDRPGWYVAELEREAEYVSAVALSPEEALFELGSAL